MSVERKKVLEMLAEGKINPEEAERLIDRLIHSSEEDRTAVEPGSGEGRPAGKLKYLRVVVNSHDNDRVNIRIPLELVRTGIKLTTMLPAEANEKLAEKGVDLSHLGKLQGEQLIEALRELNVDIDSSDGDKVRIFCE
jgi:hypothetical protein